MKVSFALGILAALPAAVGGCRRQDPAGREPGAIAPLPPRRSPELPRDRREGDAPRIVGGKGKQLPYGYWTTFTGPRGPVRLPYTQIYGADTLLKGLRIRVRSVLRHPRKGERRRVPRFRSRIVIRGEKAIGGFKDLEGRTFDRWRVGQSWMIVRLGPSVRGFVRTGRITFTKVTQDAVEGTFAGTFYPEQGGVGKPLFAIRDGRFRAFPARLRIDHSGKN